MTTIRIIPIFLAFALILPSVLPIVHADEETTVSSSDDTTGPKSTETATGSEEKKDVDASDADDAVVEKTVSEKKDLPKATSDEADVPVSGETSGTVSDSETKTGATPENTPAIEQSADSITGAPSTETPATDTLSAVPDTGDETPSVEPSPTAITAPLDPESPDKTTLAATPETATVPAVIISEVQIAGNVANDDFIELYNPGSDEFSLKGFELRRRTKADTTSTNEFGSLFHSFSDSDSIPAKGYFLWANKDGTAAFIAYADTKSPNTTSPALAANNSVALFDSTKTIVDTAAWGVDLAGPFASFINANPDKNTSLVRDSKTLAWSISKCPTPTNSKGETTEKPASCSGPTSPPVDVSPQIILSEIRIGGNGPDDEFVELYNAGTGTMNLSGFDLIRKYVSETKIDDVSVRIGKEASVTKSFPDFELPPGAFYLWANREGKYASPFADTQTGYSLSENNSLALRKKDGILIDSVSWGSDTDLTRFVATNQTLPNPGKGSLVRNLRDLSWSVVGKPTPTNNRNETMTDPELPPSPPIGTVRINEIFPNPKEKGEANEWIELWNSGSEPVSLLGWTLRSGSGKFTWTGKLPEEQRVIPSGGFLVLPRSLTRLALRNTNGAVTLTAPDGAIMDAVAYGKTSEGTSYGLADSGRFRFSKTLTPGADNVFGKEPKAKKSDIPKKGYRGMLVPFSATGNKKGMKYVWDFGDGHKSYLDTTSHRFTKTGTYRGTLTLRDGIEETVKPFTIRIGKYPNRNIHLTELCPNPDGTDTDREWVRIKNDDTKRIDLSGWIIASATEKSKLVNHVILSDRSIGPGEEIVLTRIDSRFTLPNERAVIELRRPDGKTVQTIEYFQDGGATENAVFTEIDDSVWAWSVPETGTDIPMLSATHDETGSDDSEEADPFEVGMSAAPDSDRLSFGEFVTLGTPYDPTLPDSLPRVLGASDDRLTNESSTSESLLDALFRILNGFAAGRQAE